MKDEKIINGKITATGNCQSPQFYVCAKMIPNNPVESIPSSKTLSVMATELIGSFDGSHPK